MFFVHELRPSLNVQSDSIRAKVFKYFFIKKKIERDLTCFKSCMVYSMHN